MIDDTFLNTIEKKIKNVLNNTPSIFTFSASTSKIADLEIKLEIIKNKKFGDLSTNFLLHIELEKNKIEKYGLIICKKLIKYKKIFKKVEFIQPGFINMTISDVFLFEHIYKINIKKTKFADFKKKKLLYNLEFVSANPTGLMHIGHARNAAFGETLANFWKKYGIKVIKEYYINDAGNQIEKLGLSTLIRYKEALGDNTYQMPEDGYHGNEIISIANEIVKIKKEKYLNDEIKDDIIVNDETRNFFKTFSKNYLLDVIHTDLKNFGVEMDIWTSELSIYKKKIINLILTKLKNYTYVYENATFLKTKEFGDDEDRVIIKSDGTYTYFLPDIGYHFLKYSFGYNKLFNIWGADHKSYVDRVKISMKMLGLDDNKLHVFIQQMVRLTKNGELYKMSKRTGNSLTMQDLVESIGKSAARWFLISNSLSTHLEIDVEKATKKTNDNPLFYVMYVYARICQINKKVNEFNKTKKNKINISKKMNSINAELEHDLIFQICLFKDLIKQISNSYEVHRINNYLINLAKLFHSYYEKYKIICEQESLISISCQRYTIINSIKNLLLVAFSLIGVEPTESM